MVEPRVIRRLGVEGAEKLYYDILTYAPSYLERCGITSAIQFTVWAIAENASWVELENGGLLLTDWRPGLSIRVHPITWGSKLASDSEYLASVIKNLHSAARAPRIETLVLVGIPDGIERWAERAGFEFEGCLRKSVSLCGRICDGNMYSVTEVL